jgi:hypothetical protein
MEDISILFQSIFYIKDVAKTCGQKHMFTIYILYTQATNFVKCYTT